MFQRIGQPSVWSRFSVCRRCDSMGFMGNYCVRRCRKCDGRGYVETPIVPKPFRREAYPSGTLSCGCGNESHKWAHEFGMDADFAWMVWLHDSHDT